MKYSILYILLVAVLVSCDSKNRTVIEFEELRGLEEKAGVYFKGYEVGEVQKIELSKSNNLQVTIGTGINFDIPHNAQFILYSTDILGTKAIGIIENDSINKFNLNEIQRGIIENKDLEDKFTEIANEILDVTKGNVKNKDSLLNKLDSLESNISIVIDSIEIMDNELSSELKGDWISTIFTDSIFDKREIAIWKHAFYGDLFISINDSDTLLAGGNMDFGEILFYSEDENTFVTVSDWGETKYTYSKGIGVIYIGDRPSSSVFKRDADSTQMSIIKDENALMSYVIKRLFTGDYLPQKTISKINYISLGLETYTPFSFDAIGIENEKGETEYFGWKFIDDTLELYKTTSLYDDDSGFTSYQLGKLHRKFIKKENLKCNVKIVLKMNESIDSASDELVLSFFKTFGEECKNNVEYSEFSNETLFKLIQNQTVLFCKVLEKYRNEIELNEILKELENPLHELIDLNKIKEGIMKSELNKELKAKLLDAIDKAIEKMN
ncbi:MCE family protein [Marinifilum sp. D737]|nr:MCE family protein [Marinifilum sp. D737]